MSCLSFSSATYPTDMMQFPYRAGLSSVGRGKKKKLVNSISKVGQKVIFLNADGICRIVAVRVGVTLRSEVKILKWW